MKPTVCLLIGACVLAASPEVLAGVVRIGFDELAADGVIGNATGIYSGDHYASLGVLFRTGELVAGPGGTGLFINEVNSFEVLGGPGQPAISAPNFAIPRGAGTRDLLMIFTTPVTSVSLTSDKFPETPDIIRLGALKATSTPNQFTLLGFDQKLDNAVSPPGNLLSISLNGLSFSYALFQVNTESEGFDDLTFTQVEVPEPASITIFGLSLICAMLRARRAGIQTDMDSSLLPSTSRSRRIARR